MTNSIKLNYKINRYNDLIDYVVSRTLIVFFFKITLGVLKNICLQEIYGSGFFKVLMGSLIGLSILITTLILINVAFTLIRIKFDFTLIRTKFENFKQFYNEGRNEYGLGLVISLIIFLDYFFYILINNFNHQTYKDGRKYFDNDLQTQESIVYNYEKSKSGKFIIRENKLSKIFYVIAIISVLFFKGNPFVNNYYGVYNLYIRVHG